jgi:CRP-like cAMP-binding protein
MPPVTADRLASLSRLAPFADLDPAELEALAQMVEEQSYAEGEWIVRRGQEDVGLHVIVEGEIGVVIEGTELAILPQGSFFGEISALLAEPAVADVVARSPVHCLIVPRDDVESFLLANPRVMLRMLQTEARRLRTADESRD